MARIGPWVWIYCYDYLCGHSRRVARSVGDPLGCR